MTGVPFPELIERVIQQESGGNPLAVSGAGASGLMQIMPATAADPGYGVAPMDWGMRFDVQENRRFGTEYLGALLDAFGGDQERALVAYNWGAGNAQNWDGSRASLPAETQGYLTAILGQGAPTATQRPLARPEMLPGIPPEMLPKMPPEMLPPPRTAAGGQPSGATAPPAQMPSVDLVSILQSADEAQKSLAMLPR